MFALFYTFLYINDVKKRILAIFGVVNSFTVKKVNLFTISVRFKVILSSKNGGGGIFVQATPHPKSGGGGVDTSPHPPGFTPV